MKIEMNEERRLYYIENLLFNQEADVAKLEAFYYLALLEPNGFECLLDFLGVTIL